jgi:hypothetical protein
MSPQSTVPVEPLSAAEADELLRDIRSEVMSQTNPAMIAPLIDDFRLLIRRTLDAARASRPVTATAEDVARRFHEAYERLAPSFGYETRRASAVPWDAVPENNRQLMEAVASEVLAALPVREDEPTGIVALRNIRKAYERGANWEDLIRLVDSALDAYEASHVR